MNEKELREKILQDSGYVPPDNTPMGMLNVGTKQFLKGIEKGPRLLIVRVVSIIFGTLLLFVGFLIINAALKLFQNTGDYLEIVPYIIAGSLSLFGGIFIVKENLRSTG
jgi:hypothetical protein